MTATNHTLVAANLVVAFPKWWVVPIAFVSHFVLDALPHHGEINDIKNKRFYVIYGIDFVVALFLLVFLVFTQQEIAALLVFAIIAATVPDIVWIYRDIRERSKAKSLKMNRFTKFHASIQKHEYPGGIYHEVIYFVVFISLLLVQLQ
jgi:hypothetical protein